MERRSWGPVLSAALVVGLLALPSAAAWGTTAAAHPAGFRGWVTDAVPVPAGATTRPLPSGMMLRISVTLNSPQAAALSAFLEGVQNPVSPEYHHFLSEAQFQAEFGPTTAQDALVTAYFGQFGACAVTQTPDHFGVSFDLPASALPRALGVSAVQLGTTHDAPVYTSVGAVTLPPPVGALVGGIGGLSNLATVGFSTDLRRVLSPVHLGSPIPRFVDGLGGQQWFVGSDVTQASGTATLFPGGSIANATFPVHEAVATILMSGYNESTNRDLPPYDPVAIQSYFNDTLPRSWPAPVVSGVPVTIGGATPPAPGYYNGSNDTTLDEAENSLDLEMAGSMAPGAALVNFYFAGSILAAPSSNPPSGAIADDFAVALGAALSHNYSPASLVAVSGSFGLPDLNDTLWNTELQNAAATGVTVLAASGDQGDAPADYSGRTQGEWPGWPASAAFDTYGTVAVGGLQMALSGTPNGTYYSNGTVNTSFDPTAGSYQSLSTWYDTSGGPGNISGTEGGASSVYNEPGWQVDSAAQPTIVNVTVQQGAASLGRAEPDLAFPAFGMIAYVARDAGGVYYALLEGTSIASPLFAGCLASMAAVRGGPFGFVDPALYRMGSYYAANPAAPHDPFLDVSNGSNYVFSAGPGWDGTTGWGTLEAPWFLAAIANSSIANYVYTGPTPGLPPGLFQFTNAGPPSVYFVAFVGLAGALAVIAVIVVLRPRPTALAPGPSAYAPPPPGLGPLPPYAPSYGAAGTAPTFLCPYCGNEHPAEPVRCPTCGRF